jgi:hypothetical protein
MLPLGAPFFQNHSISKTKYFSVWARNTAVLENTSVLKPRYSLGPKTLHYLSTPIFLETEVFSKIL